jgi:hypothetical protein
MDGSLSERIVGMVPRRCRYEEVGDAHHGHDQNNQADEADARKIQVEVKPSHARLKALQSARSVLGKEVSAVHVYFHREELDVLRRISAANDVSVRGVVRMIVRDFLVRNPHEAEVRVETVKWKVSA